MKSRLFYASHKEIRVIGFIVELRTEPVQGNDGAAAPDLRQPIDVFQDRHKEVHIGHGHKHQGLAGELEEMFQDGLGVVLTTFFVEGIAGILHA